MKSRMLSIGLLGCSHIAQASILRPVQELEHMRVAAVAGRDSSRARDYAAEHGIPRAHASYDDLLRDADIDLVYIALANHAHKEWAVRVAQAGKHLLIEKPICLTARELADIQQACRDNGVLCHEAIMVQHHPWQRRAKELIDSGEYGRLIALKTHISHPMRHADNYRFYPELGGGVFRDEGPYWLQFVQAVAGLAPVTYEGRSDFAGPHGSDWRFDASLSLPSGAAASFHASFDEPYQATHWIELEQARIRVKDFFRARLGRFKITLDILGYDDTRIGKIEFEPQNYYENQLTFFADVIAGRRPGVPDAQVQERTRLFEAIYQSAAAKEAL
ncbi:Gfo/Idh/MocA family protein [Paenibacillus xanthanilyticus]|uniref:Gfo/Idh/MocA family protein n=1 Tax=Paenibacillus xanthanilyticus TaxID=1783531 RepID=A0ABV8K607_9BACL